MKEIVFVTHNTGKIASAQRYLKKVNLIPYKYELNEPRIEDIKEIATAKVKEAYDIVKKPCIAQDTGFYIESLKGFPKTYVNFALETIGLDGILKLMENKENRKCSFKECLAYYDGKEIKYFYGIHEGTISEKIAGKERSRKWSDLWYIFKLKNFEMTLAEIDDEERDKILETDGSISAIKLFAEWYEK